MVFHGEGAAETAAHLRVRQVNKVDSLDGTQELVGAIPHLEAAVEALGFFDFRVRCKGDAAIVEMNELQYARALEEFGRIAEVLRRFFVTITLSDKPRKPSV